MNFNGKAMKMQGKSTNSDLCINLMKLQGGTLMIINENTTKFNEITTKFNENTIKSNDKALNFNSGLNFDQISFKSGSNFDQLRTKL